MSEEEYLECIDYINHLKEMNAVELKGELVDYLLTIKELSKRLNYQRMCYYGIMVLFKLKAIPIKYYESVNSCMEEIVYEYFYLDCIKRIIKKINKKNFFDNVLELYLCLLILNQTGSKRDYYMNDIAQFSNKRTDSNIELNVRKCQDYKDINYIIKKLKKNNK